MKIRDTKAGYKFRHVAGAENLERANAHWTVVTHDIDPYGKYGGTTLCVLSTDNGTVIDAEHLDGNLECCGNLSTYSERTANDLNGYGKKKESRIEQNEKQKANLSDEDKARFIRGLVGLAILGTIAKELESDD